MVSIRFSPPPNKKVDLYVTVMKAAYREENGGNGFVAVKLETLEGLSDKDQKLVLGGFKDLSKKNPAVIGGVLSCYVSCINK